MSLGRTPTPPLGIGAGTRGAADVGRGEDDAAEVTLVTLDADEAPEATADEAAEDADDGTPAIDEAAEEAAEGTPATEEATDDGAPPRDEAAEVTDAITEPTADETACLSASHCNAGAGAAAAVERRTSGATRGAIILSR